MKKTYLIILILLSTLNFSDTLTGKILDGLYKKGMEQYEKDKYKSKRVFDKYMTILIKRDIEKYKNDKDMKEFYQEMKERNVDNKVIQAFSGIKSYEIISIKESDDQSIIKVKINHEVFYKFSNLETAKSDFEKYKERKGSPKSLSDYADLLIELDGNTKYQMKSEEIEVKLIVVNGIWTMEGKDFLSFMSMRGYSVLAHLSAVLEN